MLSTQMKTGWWSFELPGVRPHPRRATYSLFRFEDLPPLAGRIDTDFEWLRSQPLKQRSLFEGCDSDGNKPDLGKLAAIASEAQINLPAPFAAFIRDTDLHQRIRSCTDCYLDLADHAVRTTGGLEGYLFHFLSDSQWVGHWYLHVDPHGHHFIATSMQAYGFDFVDGDGNSPAHQIDMQKEDIWFCAQTFTEFIYRFWLENEIWFALAYDKRALTEQEQAYIDGYSQPRG